MQNVWMLSPFTTDVNGDLYPTCNAYAAGWAVPWNPTTGNQALVYCSCSDTQLSAVSYDPTIAVCPLNLQCAAPAVVTQVYASTGASTGMCMAELITLLGALDSNFIQASDSLQFTASAKFLVPPTATAGVAQAELRVSANGIALSPILIQHPVVFKNIYAPSAGKDTVNLHSVGVYGMDGTLLVASTPQVYPADGVFPVSPTTLLIGQYSIAWTCNGVTPLLLPGTSTLLPGWAAAGTATTSAAALLPAKVATPDPTNVVPSPASCLSFGFC